MTDEDRNTRNPIDQQRLPPQGKARTAIVAIVIIVVLILIAFFVGLRFSTGKGILLIPGGSVSRADNPLGLVVASDDG